MPMKAVESLFTVADRLLDKVLLSDMAHDFALALLLVRREVAGVVEVGGDWALVHLLHLLELHIELN